MLTTFLALFVRLQTNVTTQLRREEGQGLTEYALILALVVLIGSALLLTLGNDINSKIKSITDQL